MLTDARGIPCGYVCEKCEAKKRSGYRPEIFENGAYEAEESIEPEAEVGRPAYGSQQWAETYSDDLGESPDY